MNRYYKGNFHHLEKFRMSITREELAATVKDVLTQIIIRFRIDPEIIIHLE